MRVVQGQLQEAGALVALKVSHATGYAMIWDSSQGPTVDVTMTATNALNIHRHLTYTLPCKHAALTVCLPISFYGMPTHRSDQPRLNAGHQLVRLQQCFYNA